MGIFHMPPKVLYTFQGMNPQKWGFHLRKCKAGNEACQMMAINDEMINLEGCGRPPTEPSMNNNPLLSSCRGLTCLVFTSSGTTDIDPMGITEYEDPNQGQCHEKASSEPLGITVKRPISQGVEDRTPRYPSPPLCRSRHKNIETPPPWVYRDVFSFLPAGRNFYRHTLPRHP